MIHIHTNPAKKYALNNNQLFFQHCKSAALANYHRRSGEETFKKLEHLSDPRGVRAKKRQSDAIDRATIKEPDSSLAELLAYLGVCSQRNIYIRSMTLAYNTAYDSLGVGVHPAGFPGRLDYQDPPSIKLMTQLFRQ